jgi:p-cumate 2,3-dioxygenase subunit alpha
MKQVNHMDIGQLIIDRPDQGIFRVHRSAMTAQDIFEKERELIFDRCWLYVGHDSEIEKPGEFRRRDVAGRPLIFIRGSDDMVRILYNSCTHRGANVCVQDEGQATGFTCIYHAWRFNNKGELASVPDPEGYGEGFDKASLTLKSPPRAEQYRGMYFVNYNTNAESLESYLDPIRELLDLTLDSAETLGGWHVIHGSAKYSLKTNWKLLVENSYDGYHLPSVHSTYIDYLTWRQKKMGIENPNPTGSDARDAGSLKRTRSFAARNGHGGMLHRAQGRAIANPSPLWPDDTKQEVMRVKSELIAKFGEKRARQMSEVSRHICIFPNLIFQDTQTGFRFRQIWPVEPGLIDVMQWDLIPRNERQDLRDARMEYSLAFLGPGGLATPDDAEALEACQRGFAAREVEWSDISRGMKREPQLNDELQMRSFWRQWHGCLRGEPKLVMNDDRERSGLPTINLDA